MKILIRKCEVGHFYNFIKKDSDSMKKVATLKKWEEKIDPFLGHMIFWVHDS